MAKPPLLFLSHRIPYPPNKGDKIRSFNILKELSRHYSIYLGTFIDDDDDWTYSASLDQFCTDKLLVQRVPLIEKTRSLLGLLSWKPLSVKFYQSSAMQRWVDDVVTKHRIDRAFLFCSPMYQFVAPNTVAARALSTIIMDLVDVDSEKWRQYSQQSRIPISWLYRREATTLLSWESASVDGAQHSFLVSQTELELFRSRSKRLDPQISFYSNGVDTEFFSPCIDVFNPYKPGVKALVFTGAMDYAPNVDAVCWFAEEVMPHIDQNHNAEFWVVGSNPSSRVSALASDSRVHVTGRVPDVRPYLKYAHAAVAPMRIARGVQNKVLEAMAMEKPVVASDFAMDGLEIIADTLISGGGSRTSFVSAVNQTLRQEGHAPEARIAVVDHFTWEPNLRPLLKALSASLSTLR